MSDIEDFDDYLKQVIKGSATGISESHVFTALVSKHFMDNPQCILQIGLAVLMDKPIAVIGIDGQKIPENLKKIAIVIEHVSKPDDRAGMERAVTAISKAISEATNH